MFSRRNFLPALIIIIVAALLGFWMSDGREEAPPQNTAPVNTGSGLQLTTGTENTNGILTSPSAQANATPTGIADEASSPPVPTLPPDYKPYTDPEKKFTLSIPPSWTAEKLPTEAIGSATDFAGPDAHVKLIAHEESGSDLQTWIAARDAESRTAYEGQPSKKILRITAITVNGLPAIEREEEWLAAGFTTTVTYLQRQNTFYVLQLEPNAEKPASKLLETYGHILNSLKLN